MKKIILTGTILALTSIANNASAQSEVRTGTIETINLDGTGTLRDSQTGELRKYITRDGEFHFENAYKTRDGEFHYVIGSEVSYLAQQAQGIDQQKLDSILGLIR